MNRRRLMLSLLPLALAAQSLPLHAAKLGLNTISNYFNRLQTASGEFTQVNADGTISTGRLFIRRPGRIRFEYDPPDAALVMAGGGQVAIFDGKSNQPPEQYPLARTPLNVILAPTVDLARARMVVAHTYDGTATSVTAQDSAHPEYGTIRLVFTDNPLELRQWVITDDVGNETTVILGALRTGVNLPSTLFNIAYEEGQRRRR